MNILASITKRGKTWQYAVSNFVDGKSRPIRKSGFKTKKEAEIASAEIELRLSKGAQVVTKNKSFVDYFLDWVNVYKKDSRHYTTYDRYVNSCNVIKAYFKDTPIQKITHTEYQKFIKQYGEGKSKETVRKLNTHVRACVTRAIMEGLITNDFTYKVELHYTVKPKKEDDKYINFEESKSLYNHLINSLDAKNLSHYMILLALVTGARYGELVGLTDNDFDFKDNMLDINKTWKYKLKDANEFGDLKADGKPRKIGIDTDVMSKFKELLTILPQRPHELVFYSYSSKKMVITNNAVNKALGHILSTLKIDETTIHSMRHTHASALLYSGSTIQYVSERLGHVDITTTYNTYTHVLKELKDKDESIAVSLYGAKCAKNVQSNLKKYVLVRLEHKIKKALKH